MRSLQYQGPYDSFDASNLTGKPGTVFYSPTTTSVPADMRGNVIAVTNEQAENLETYPLHRFVQVPDADAKRLMDRQKAAREMREQQYALFARDSDNMQPAVPTTTIDQQIASLPTGQPPADSTPATAAQIRAETRAGATQPATDSSSTTASAPVTGE